MAGCLELVRPAVPRHNNNPILGLLGLLLLCVGLSGRRSASAVMAGNVKHQNIMLWWLLVLMAIVL